MLATGESSMTYGSLSSPDRVGDVERALVRTRSSSRTCQHTGYHPRHSPLCGDAARESASASSVLRAYRRSWEDEVDLTVQSFCAAAHFPASRGRDCTDPTCAGQNRHVAVEEIALDRLAKPAVLPVHPFPTRARTRRTAQGCAVLAVAVVVCCSATTSRSPCSSSTMRPCG